MRSLIVVFISCLNLFQSEYSSLRNSFQKSRLTHENAKKFYEETLQARDLKKEYLILAYQGAAKVSLSKFQKKIKDKKKFLKEGVYKIEESINNHPEEIELRLIRLIIQENLPRFLKYHKNIQEDKAFVLSNYRAQKEDMKNWIKEYIFESQNFTKEEKESFVEVRK